MIILKVIGRVIILSYLLISSIIIIGPLCVIAAAMPHRIEEKIVHSPFAFKVADVFAKNFDFHTKLWFKIT